MKYQVLTLLVASSFFLVSCGATDGGLNANESASLSSQSTETGQSMGATNSNEDIGNITFIQEATNQNIADTRDGITSEVDMIRVISPEPDALVGTELALSGSAKAWYFEGSFPVSVLDENRDILYEGSISAKGDWMTTDFVAFEEKVILTKKPSTKRGKVIFRKANPSGLPEFDASFETPIRFE